MNPVQATIKGGDFLISEIIPDLIFTPEDRSDEHKMIADTARQFIAREIHPYRKQIEAGDFQLVSRKMKHAGDLGLLGHSIPEKYGGLGLDKVSKGIVGEALGNASGYSVAHSNHTCIATLPITYFGTPEQKEKYLPKLASGEFIGAYCLTEPEAGSDALSAKTTGVLNEAGTHYILNGTKIYITNASFADTFIVYAKVDGEFFTAFIIERDFKGLSIGPEEDKMGIKGSSTCSVVMEDCEVPEENLLGEVGKGHLIALNVLNLGRFNLGFATMGAAKYSLKLALEHTTERKQFGHTVAQFNATKQKLAQMSARIYATESLLYRTAGYIESALGKFEDSNDYSSIAKAMNEHALESAICKITGSETLDYIVDESLQLHGGAGFIKDYPIEQAYRDSRINRIFEGTNEINRLLIPGSFYKKAAKQEFDAETLMEKANQSLREGSKEGFPGPLEKLQQAVRLFKDLYLVSAGVAYKVFGNAIQTEQETLMKLADLAIAIYESESVILRTMKAIESSDRQAGLKTDMAFIFLEKKAFEVQQTSGELLSYLLNGEERRKALRNLALLLSEYQFEDSIERQRSIAKVLIEEKQYIS
ncbi:putative acyl-CoA dehydrogenase [Halobacillus andaensis]|uniref:Acyl-CoA dehydrogenase n=1 Tax=Halobacillus andaensis TaxID=1176239 RepID=A0A917B5G7_HALAA|nr:acyl-CoA dehydrogenase family protein [Halobacillus andaensis]MBP2005921.1 alkylation response protein AidB-like acyl-CoA dehydrogenase [Halobacillus andaensis]GGF25030.1 putative acyl-CoA dehydrogenase [Halobacillus andaensis]